MERYIGIIQKVSNPRQTKNGNWGIGVFVSGQLGDIWFNKYDKKQEVITKIKENLIKLINKEVVVSYEEKPYGKLFTLVEQIITEKNIDEVLKNETNK